MIEQINEPVTSVTENVEDLTTEELVDGAKAESEGQELVQNAEQPNGKFYTNKEIKNMKLRYGERVENRIRKEYEKKYGKLENVLKAGTGVETVEEMTDTFADFYTKRGIKIPSTSQYSDRDMEYLAERDANEIIEGGYEEISDELNRLSDIGVENMTPSDKHIFLKLKQEADRITNERELKSIGVTELPEGFNDFANKLNPSLSLKEKYEMYTQMNPKKKGEMIGSMKSNSMKDNGVKERYTYEEAIKFTREDLDKNPDLVKAIEESMKYWN